MADKKKKQKEELTAEAKLINKISDFVSLNRNLILIALVALMVVVIGIVVFSTVSSSSKDKAIVRVTSYEDSLSKAISEGTSTDEIATNLAKEVKGSSYSSMKAQYLIGYEASAKKDYAKAYEEFMKCYNLDNSQYIAKLALFNAAVCKDNLKDTSGALDLYNKIVEGNYELGIAARAMFNIGRIYYEDNNMELAKASFQQLIDNYPGSEFTAIAKNIVNLM